MPARLPDDLRYQVIVLWISGYTIEAIADEVEASGGSVRNIVQELRERRYPEFKNYVADLEDLRRLYQQVRARKHSLQEALTGLAVYEGLTGLGLDPAGLKDQIELFERVSPPDFPADHFARSALRVIKLESETGMTVYQLEIRATQVKSEIAKDENRIAELTNAVNSLRTAEENARQSLEHRLVQNKVTEQGLESFLQERDALRKVGLGPGDIRPVADLIAKSGTEKVLAAARELAALTGKTGKSPQALVQDYEQTMMLKEKAVAEHNQAKAGVQKSMADLQQLQQARVNQLAQNGVTDAGLSNFLSAKKQLATWGIGLDKPEVLKKVLSEIETHGYRPDNIVAYLQSIVSLQDGKRQLETQVANTQNELHSGKKDLQATNNEIAGRAAELAKLKAAEEQARITLSELQLQTIRTRERVELVETFLQLLHDPAKIPNERIAMLIVSLQQILKTRATIQGLPIDYDPLRKRFKLLIEEVLGDTLLPREKLDAEMRKLYGQHAILSSQKKELDLERSRVDQMTQGKLLEAAISQNRKGIVFVGVCGNCRSTAAVRRGAASRYLFSYHCPCCSIGTLDSRPLSSRNEK